MADDVQQVYCSQCGAEPGDDCTGPGEGWHLSRFDRLADMIADTEGQD